jgi:hypothetical protein
MEKKCASLPAGGRHVPRKEKVNKNKKNVKNANKIHSKGFFPVIIP